MRCKSQHDKHGGLTLSCEHQTVQAYGHIHNAGTLSCEHQTVQAYGHTHNAGTSWGYQCYTLSVAL